MTLGLHNVSSQIQTDLALRQDRENVEQISGLRRPCRGCGRAEARRGRFFCSDHCRFWAKVQKGPLCWLWTGARSGGRNRRAYGQFNSGVDNKPIGAHVWSYQQVNGPVPDGLEIMHQCHTPLCVRPDHLIVGTHDQNNKDSAAAGHFRVSHPSTQKLTDEQVADIIAFCRANGRGSNSRMAEKYGVTRSYVGMLLRGIRRKYDVPLQLKQVG